MELPPLNDEQLERVREFFASDAAKLLFDRLETEVLAAWLVAQNVTEREQCWFRVQAVLELQAKLRDAPADKRLTERSQAARQAPVTPAYGPRN